MQIQTHGRGLIPDIDSSTRHLWTCDEASGSLLSYTNSVTIPVNSGGATSVNSPVGLARAYGGGDSHYDAGATSGSDSTTFQNEYTLSVLLRLDPDEEFGAVRTVLGYGASGGTSASNYQGYLNINTDQTISWIRESGTKVEEEVTSSWLIRRGKWTLIQIRNTDEGGTHKTELFINGVYVEDLGTGITPASGGGNAVWFVGGLLGSSQYFTGDISYIFFSGRALTDDECSLQWEAALMLTVPTYVDAYVVVDDQDMSDFHGHNWLEKIRYDDSVDNLSRNATVSFTRDIGRMSLSWLRSDSRLNLTDDADFDSYSPLVVMGKDIDIYFARMPLWVEPTPDDWCLVFEGEINSVDATSSTLTVECQDFGCQLSRNYIKVPTTYSSSGTDNIEEVEADILSDWSTLTLFVEENSLFELRKYEQGQDNVHNVLRGLSALRGFDTKVKWDQGTEQHRLTMFDPGRSRIDTDFSIRPSHYYSVQKLVASRDQIRNDIDGIFPDSLNLDSEGNPTPTTSNVFDNDSQLAYGEHWASVTSSVSSKIDTEAKNLVFINSILSDLKDPQAEFSVDMPLRFEFEAYDYCNVFPNFVHDNVSRRFGSVSAVHEWDRQGLDSSTILNFRERTSGGTNRAMDMLGGNNNPHPSVVAASFPDLAAFTITDIVGGIRVSYPAPDETFKKRWKWTEMHVSATDVVPSSLTVRGRAKATSFDILDLQPGTTYFVKAVVIDVDNRQAVIDLGSVAPRYFGDRHQDPYAMDARIAMIRNAGFNVSTLGPIINFPPDNWRMNAGTWNTDSLLNTTIIQSGRYSLNLATNTADVRSVRFPVTKSLPYKFNWATRTDSISPTSINAVRVRWYDIDGFVISTGTLRNTIESAINTWAEHSAYATAPSTAVTAEIGFDRASASGSFNVYFDRIEMNESRPGFEARKTSGTTTLVNKVYTKCTFNSEQHDHGDVYSTANNRFTARRTAKHTFSASVQTAAVGTLVLVLYKNGTSWITGGVARDGGAGMPLTASVTVSSALLTKGDYVEVYAYYSSTGNTTMATSANTNHFSGREIE